MSKAARCGVFLPLMGLDWPTLRSKALLIERSGYDSLWLDDHFWFPGRPDDQHLEVWTALTALACSTERLLLGPLVLCQSFRSPSLLAKMAASLSQISSERLVLGIGAGWMEEEYRAYGYAMPTPRARLEQLGETLEILRRMWSEERATFQGRHYGVLEAPLLPKPKKLPVILGGASERLLVLAARHADGWNCPNPNWRELAAKRERLRQLCEAEKRDPATIEVSEQVMVVLGRDDAAVAREKARAIEALGAFVRFDGDVHVGRPEQVAEGLRSRLALGVSRLMVMFGDFGSDEQIELFAREVLPALAAET